MSPSPDLPARSRLQDRLLAACLVWALGVVGGFAWCRVVNAASFQRLLHRVER